MDADMLCLTDICSIMDIWSHKMTPSANPAVRVVKHDRRFEWPSLMLFDCDQCKELTQNLVETGTPQDLMWADSVGELNPSWNHLVGYDKPNPDAKIVHFTQGIPAFKETWDCEYGEAWRKELDATRSTVSWEDIMGKSVHKQAMGL